MMLPGRLLLVYLSILLFSFSTSVLSTNTCNFNVKVKQALHNEGFHRNMTYGIVFNSEDERERWLYKDCVVGVEQKLPAGVYANPDELGDLRRSHRILVELYGCSTKLICNTTGFSVKGNIMRKPECFNFELNAIPKSKINIELPTEQSSEISIFIIGKMFESNVYLWLPVHARYHQAVPGGGMSTNEIGAPTLYLRCPDERLDMCDKNITAVTFLCNGSSKEKCRWKEIPYTMMTDTLTWYVPVGNTDHYYVVAIGTTAAIIIATLYLLKTIHEYNISVKKKQY